MRPQQLQESKECTETNPGPSSPTGQGESYEAAAVHSLIRFPVPGAARIPSEAEMALLSNEAERDKVVSLAGAAHESVMKVQVAGELAPVLGMFVAYLVDVLVGDDERYCPAFEGPVCLGATLGYVIGTMENASGVARPGKSEGHYQMAMHVAQAGLPLDLQTIAYEYAKESGYYLARTGEDSFDEIVIKASACMDQLRLGVEV